MKEKLFQIYFCIFIFWEAILYTFLGQRGVELDGGIMRLVLVSLFGVAGYFYLTIGKKGKGESWMIFLLFLFGNCYYMTQYFTPGKDFRHVDLYMGQLLRWGSDCIPACLIGMTLLKLRSYNIIHKILPWLCMLLTPFMAVSSLTQGIDAGQYSLEGGFNYQNIAYNMAVLFCFSFYYTFVAGDNVGKIIKLLTAICMIVQAVTCAMSGGRGGLVLLVIYIGYMMYYLLQRNILSKGKIISICIAGALAFVALGTKVGLWQSAGFQRSSNSMNDKDRTEMWANIWHYVSDNEFIGYGLGGDYFTFGFYTHNIILDFCLELGIIGAIVMIVLFYKTYKRIWTMANYNQIFVVVMILFIYGVVMNMFSGYWISTNTNWMAFGIAMTYANYYRYHQC